MNLVALDSSTPRLSLAWARDGEVRAAVEAETGRGLSVDLFGHLDDLRDQAGGTWSDVDAWVVGRGPGGYTGLRAGFATALGFALPGDTPVWAVDSGVGMIDPAALPPGARVAVVGDARRGTRWVGGYRVASAEDPLELDDPGWRTLAPDRVASELEDGCHVVSPEWERVAEDFRGHEARLRLPASSTFPSAALLLRAALNRHGRGLPFPPPVPLYLHPAVAPPA